MNVLVDTCIWSLALRRKTTTHTNVVNQLSELITEARVKMIGPIRQEILSGISSQAQFDQLRQDLAAFPDHPVLASDYEDAAKLYNLCRGKGIQGSNTDFLICAIAINYKMAIFTIDNDFNHFNKILPIHLLLTESI